MFVTDASVAWQCSNRGRAKPGDSLAYGGRYWRQRPGQWRSGGDALADGARSHNLAHRPASVSDGFFDGGPRLVIEVVKPAHRRGVGVDHALSVSLERVVIADAWDEVAGRLPCALDG